MHIDEIKTRTPFNELFTIDQGVLEAIVENMRHNGFDMSQPIIIWQDHDVVIDGHTRLAAAHLAGIRQIPTFARKFEDEPQALAYAIHNQRNRRNLTDAELLRCIEKVDQLKGAGRPAKELAQPCTNLSKGKSSEQTAKVVGISARKVSQARTVISDPETARAVKAGKMSINKGALAVRAKRQPAMKESITSESDKRQEILLHAWEELSAWRKKYNQYPEFKEIFWAIDVSMEKRRSAGRNPS